MIAKDYILKETKIITMAGNLNRVEQAMIEFAKYHVEKALKEASVQATMKVEYPDEFFSEYNEYGQTFISAHEVECGGDDGYIEIEEKSILNSYPLENIK